MFKLIFCLCLFAFSAAADIKDLRSLDVTIASVDDRAVLKTTLHGKVYLQCLHVYSNLSENTDVAGLIAFLRERSVGKTLRLDLDRQGRTLRGDLWGYLFDDDQEKSLNEQAVEMGLAPATCLPPNLRYGKEIALAEDRARKMALGIFKLYSFRGQILEIKFTKKFIGPLEKTAPGLRVAGELFTLVDENGALAPKNWRSFLGEKVTIVGRIRKSRIVKAPPPPYIEVVSLRGRVE